MREQLEVYTESKDVDHYIKVYRQYNESNHDKLVKSFPHVKETLKKLHQSGIHRILRALEHLTASPENTLMVGDSEYDIFSAKGAHVASAAVAWSLKGEAFLKTYSPDFVIHDIRELENMVFRQF